MNRRESVSDIEVHKILVDPIWSAERQQKAVTEYRCRYLRRHGLPDDADVVVYAVPNAEA